MHENAEILARLIDEDFGLEFKDGSRWAKSEVHDSLVLDNERGLFYFNSRQIVGDPLVYLTKVRNLSFDEAKKYLEKFKNYSSTFTYTVNSDKPDTVVFPQLVGVFHQDGLSPEKREYWYSRGINDLTIDRFQIGWYNEFATVPIFVDGTFRNFQLRKDNPKTIRQYYKGVGPLLFNSDILKLVDTVYITEGLTDCIKMNQEGFPAVSHNDGAGGWQSNWCTYFFRQKQVYVIFDNDTAGRKGINKVAKNLGIYRCKVFNFAGFDEKYDCVEFFRDGGTSGQLKELIHTKSKYIFEGD